MLDSKEGVSCFYFHLLPLLIGVLSRAKCSFKTDTSLRLRQGKWNYGRQSASTLPFHLPPSPTMVRFEAGICASFRMGYFLGLTY